MIDVSVEKDVPGAVRKLSGARGAHYAFDPVGGSMLNTLLLSLDFRRTLVSLGFAGGKQPAFDVVDTIVHEKRTVGYSLHAEKDEDLVGALEQIVALAAEGRIPPIIDTVVHLEEFERGYSRLISQCGGFFVV